MSVNRAALPAALYTAEQTRALDRTAIEQFGIPGIRLMQRAGHAVFAEIMERFPQIGKLSIFTGAGNNGGDGFIIAQLARQKSLDVQLICIGKQPFSDQLRGEALEAWQLLQASDGSYEMFDEQTAVRGELIVDAMLGTGLSGQVRGDFAKAIALINRCGQKVFAVDIPSGLCADTGNVLGEAVKADLTLSFIGLKRGLLTGDAVDYCGTLLFDDLKVPEEVYRIVTTRFFRTCWPDLLEGLPKRARSAHKGRFGHLLIIAGNRGMGGAALLASQAAMRSGAGLVSLATRAEHLSASLTRCPEVMCHAVETVAGLKPLLLKADTVVIGPGLGQDAWAEQMLREVLNTDKRLVLDADALNLMSEKHLFQARENQNFIITPHPGEAARILNTGVAELSQDRFAAVEALQTFCGGTVVLKGAGSLSCAGDEVYLCNKGNPGMAVGGMGDVLSGICGAFLCQGMPAEQAARLAVYAHACAADRVAMQQGEIGLLASDVSQQLPKVINAEYE